ncbi:MULTISPECIES: RluA family pseudouridine synthase [unclassified Carboxylicivirga]|uniref:RluA family pseudouridine synthase n=1 Tax=Carboxylicivirga TaxID=1628153 RepID=UPI003D32E824
MAEHIAQEEFDELEESNELYEHYRFVTDAGQKPLRIDKFLVNRVENASRNKIQDAAAAGNIRVNDIPVKSNYKIKPNEVITIVMSFPRRELKIIAQDIPLEIPYEDDDLIIINKKPGMVVHPGHGNYTNTMVNALAWHLKDVELFNSEDPRPGLVHRIDKDTSGLLVVAKTEQAKNFLARQFFEKTSTRTYVALVWGQLKEDEGTITGNVGRSLQDRKQMAVFPEGDRGKHAVTHYKVLERLGYVTLVECRLETGRTHQIRAHMKYLGHPLFNDERYGGHNILKGTTFTKYKQFVQNCFKILPRQALHAKTLGFVHPSTKEYIDFNTEIPDDMMECIEKWRAYIAGREND